MKYGTVSCYVTLLKQQGFNIKPRRVRGKFSGYTLDKPIPVISDNITTARKKVNPSPAPHPERKRDSGRLSHTDAIAATRLRLDHTIGTVSHQADLLDRYLGRIKKVEHQLDSAREHSLTNLKTVEDTIGTWREEELVTHAEHDKRLRRLENSKTVASVQEINGTVDIVLKTLIAASLLAIAIATWA